VTPPPGEGLRRILVAVDPSEHGRAALEVAAHLAALLEAELEGLYVEDADLLRLEGATMLREVDTVSGQARPLRTGDVERELQSEAASVRRLLAAIASHFGVHWTFRVARGRVHVEVEEAAHAAELVTLGVRSRSVGRGPGSTVRALVRGGAGAVLIVRRGMYLRPDLHVLDDGSEEARRAVEVAERLTRAPGAALTVHVAPEPGEDEDALAARVDSLRKRLGARGRREAGVEVAPPEPRGAASILCRRSCGVLVVPRNQVEGGEGQRRLRRLLEQAGCPVLVVG